MKAKDDQDGGLGVPNPSSDADLDYTSSVKVTALLVEQIVALVHHLPEDSLLRSAQQEVKQSEPKTWKKERKAEGSCATENRVSCNARTTSLYKQQRSEAGSWLNQDQE